MLVDQSANANAAEVDQVGDSLFASTRDDAISEELDGKLLPGGGAHSSLSWVTLA